jgi:L-amino acid N-acyltransferase YncA
MEKMVKLKDGSDIMIRQLKKEDVDLSYLFFTGLPEDDRAYLRVDVTKRENVERRIQGIEQGNVIRLVALHEGNIVADGALELEGHGWEDHMAELRLIVARPFQHKGLGMIMARELFMLAASRRIEEVVVKFMGPQIRAQRIFKKLGFRQDALMHDYVKDIRGDRQDLILMRCDLEFLWRKLDSYITDFDWQRTR